MLGKFWRWARKKPQTAGVHDRPFGTVRVSRRIAEYRGALPRTRAFEIEHWLFADRITPAIAKAMLDQGFRGFGTGKPTHVLYCCLFLLRDKGTPRCLFCIYLDLNDLRSTDFQDWLAARIAAALSRSLVSTQEVAFLVRCKNDREFPWCLGAIDLDDYWLSECGKFYRFYMRRARELKMGERIRERPK